MNNKTKGLVAGLAGAAVLAGGSTFALWSDSDTVDGGAITAGNLDVAAIGTPAWFDTSADRTDADHAINLATFRMVPGDTIRGEFQIDGALEGDNMVAQLGLTTSAAPGGALLAPAEGVTINYHLEDGAGATVAGSSGTLGSPASIEFASTDNPLKGTLPTFPIALDGTADYTLVVEAEFDETTPAQVRVQAQADLQDLLVSLNQDRTAAIGGGF